jgi:hypothetical protein
VAWEVELPLFQLVELLSQCAVAVGVGVVVIILVDAGEMVLLRTT